MLQVKAFHSLLIVFSLAAGFAVSGEHDNDQVPDTVEVKTENGVSYVEGGIGDDQQKRVEEISSNYSLKITFANHEGKYLSGVAVDISNSEGTVLTVESDGPLLNVDLAPGTYEVKLKPVDFSGESKQFTVEISEEPTVLNVTWNA